MPNNVINELNFIGEQKDIDKILSLIHGEEEDQYIDFNKIIPMPDYIYRGDLGRKEQELYGKNNWYDWSNSHWGTNWNAYYQEKKENTIFFNTAWSIPYPIYEKLAEICYENDVTFEGEWCNEDWSFDSGEFDAMEGAFYAYDDETDEQHLERCRQMWGYDPKDEEYINEKNKHNPN